MWRDFNLLKHTSKELVIFIIKLLVCIYSNQNTKVYEIFNNALNLLNAILILPCRLGEIVVRLTVWSKQPQKISGFKSFPPAYHEGSANPPVEVGLFFYNAPTILFRSFTIPLQLQLQFHYNSHCKEMTNKVVKKLVKVLKIQSLISDQ